MSADELMQLHDAVQKHGFQWRHIACEHSRSVRGPVRNQYNRSFGVQHSTLRIPQRRDVRTVRRLSRQRTTSSSRAPYLTMA